MEKMTINLLILEDNPDDAELMLKELKREGFTVEWSRVETEEAFRKALEKRPDLILADYVVPSFSGTDGLKMQQEIAPDIPLIIISGKIGEDTAVECVKSGAIDYVLKDRLFRLAPVVKRALDEAEEHRKHKQAQEHIIHLNSVLKAIRQVNQLVVVEKNRTSLLHKTCDALVQARGYDGAWLGFLGNDKAFATVVGSGLGEGVSRFSEHVMAGDHPPCIRVALDQKGDIVIVDKSRECGDCFFKSTCKGKEAAIIRVERADRFFGLLAILFAPDVAVDEEEKGLLKEVAGDIAFGLHDMEMEKERKRAEKELRESEQKLRNVFENSTNLFYSHTTEHVLTYLSPQVEDILGYTVEEALIKWTELASDNPMNEEGFRKTIEAIKTGKIQPPYELELLHKNGAKVKVEVREAPVVRNGKTVAIVGALTNITERKRAEEELKEREEKYRTLVESSTDAILMMDNERKIVSYNQAFLDLFGYKKHEVEGKSIRIIHQSDEKFQSFTDTAYTVIEKDGFFRGEWGFICKDGTILPVETVTSAIKSPDGSTSGYVAIIRDITERIQAKEESVRLETQLQQAQKMEAIGTLAGGIAHDFNNILAAIIGFAELAKMRVPEDSEILPNLDQILKSGNRAKTLIQQILAFSRKQELEQKPLQLKYIVKESLKFLKSTLPTDIEIKQDIAKDVGIVNADPSQMQQVIMNLCTNAGHAMQEEGGVLGINLQNVSIGDWRFRNSEFKDKEKQSAIRNPKFEIGLDPGPYLRLTVRDTGHGMTPDVKDRIFEPYFTTKEKGVGTGLGLSVVNGIIDSHGGTITVYSEPGKGSTFHVYLPLIQEEAIKPEIDEQARILTGNERILFIDDEPTIVEIGKQMLERLGYEVTTKTSSIEALELFRNNPDQFDLVITDMTMPKMTGDKLAKELMKIRPDIPIIICTGFSERISEEKAKGMGIKAFAMKPLVMQDLAKTVRKVLDG